MPVLLILLAAAFIELTVLVAVGNAIGVLATLGLLILASLAGAVLLRHEGIRTLVAFNEALRTRRPPHREVIDGMLLAAAGVLIVLPGFVSDVLGLLLLLPPTRALVRRRLLRSAEQRTSAGFTPGRPAAPGPVADGTVVEGTVVEGEIVDEPPTRHPGTEVR